ncbi:hypothetical protein FDUTEX481_09919 [Tolypothrix sp. PCC 7601]|nr:hypothetical protein FDUTEX481_09919 [Tolypothrix sp. PCC 7601]
MVLGICPIPNYPLPSPQSLLPLIPTPCGRGGPEFPNTCDCLYYE